VVQSTSARHSATQPPMFTTAFVALKINIWENVFELFCSVFLKLYQIFFAAWYKPPFHNVFFFLSQVLWLVLYETFFQKDSYSEHAPNFP
jgi:hypothetical protein